MVKSMGINFSSAKDQHVSQVSPDLHSVTPRINGLNGIKFLEPHPSIRKERQDSPPRHPATALTKQNLFSEHGTLKL